MGRLFLRWFPAEGVLMYASCGCFRGIVATSAVSTSQACWIEKKESSAQTLRPSTDVAVLVEPALNLA